ncbi:helix-turn-helix transcriptional regulator [Thauera aromatica]|uniref:helix-turn-helix domain-containing protein n=1 Tax=Thauera aromatica TaxID=59405 RepID=UPI001FFDE23D|nr:helix-turn-helix transcriptional regulator [Thauera aromatica]MCK2086943.1 helix-turn-helix transcriptional regulator [Thauera aromatica]
MSDFQSMVKNRLSINRYSVNRHIDCDEYQNVDMDTFGSRLRLARRRAKLSQVQLAKMVGMSQGNLSDIENDHVPTSTFTPKLAAAVDVPAIWLSDGKGPDPFASAQGEPPDAAPTAPPLPTTRGRARSPLRATGNGAAAKSALDALAAELEAHPPDVETERRLAQELQLQVEWLKAIRGE